MTNERHNDFTVLELLRKFEMMLKEDPTIAYKVVIVEGCDCVGRWDGSINTVKESPFLEDNEILLGRTD